MKVTASKLPEVLVIDPQVFGDQRGYFFESWSADRYAAHGVPRHFVQDNISRSEQGVLRGLHLQQPGGQGKLVLVLEGEVFDVVVDLRVGSPTWGKWVGYVLSAANKRQLYIPPGFAHGFCVTSDHALFAYKVTDNYQPQNELSVRWDDPTLAIDWPTQSPKVSAKDAAALLLADIPIARLPRYEGPSA
jgi:dTDP-4-dehydrorhamnose 3,5-epimerase